MGNKISSPLPSKQKKKLTNSSSSTDSAAEDHLPQHSYEVLLKLFSQYSKTHTAESEMSYDVFAECVLPRLLPFEKILRSDVKDRISQRICEHFDRDGSGGISFTELLQGCELFMNDKRGRMELMYFAFDFDSNNELDRQEMHQVLSCLFPELFVKRFTSQKFDQLFDHVWQKADQNKDGVVSKAEFIQLMENDHELWTSFWE